MIYVLKLYFGQLGRQGSMGVRAKVQAGKKKRGYFIRLNKKMMINSRDTRCKEMEVCFGGRTGRTLLFILG